MVSIGEHSLNGNERDCLFRNNGDGSFTDAAYVNDADRIEDGRGVAIVDYDQDGAPDIALRNYKQPAQLLHNTGGGSWLSIKLIGTRSNRDAVGARITLRANGLLQSREVHAGSAYLSGSSLVQHFGLGDAARATEISVRWPSGVTTHIGELRAGRQWILREGDGEAQMVTDWRAPGPTTSGP